ncbi:MAG: hypothetical protein QXK93_00360 [Candidatus Bathyarchaeia archaeon]|nr:hypothetical protein [Candidatus Bathyarchaeota archaeon]
MRDFAPDVTGKAMKTRALMAMNPKLLECRLLRGILPLEEYKKSIKRFIAVHSYGYVVDVSGEGGMAQIFINTVIN